LCENELIFKPIKCIRLLRCRMNTKGPKNLASLENRQTFQSTMYVLKKKIFYAVSRVRRSAMALLKLHLTQVFPNIRRKNHFWHSFGSTSFEGINFIPANHSRGKKNHFSKTKRTNFEIGKSIWAKNSSMRSRARCRVGPLCVNCNR
jgi:hypothetical protein